MGSQVSTFHSVITMQVSLFILLAMLGITTASTWQAAPYTLFREKRAAQPQRTRFFTGNNAIDAGAAGAALGVATQFCQPDIQPLHQGRQQDWHKGNKQQNIRRTDFTEWSSWLFCWVWELLWLMLLLETLVDDRYIQTHN